MMILLDTNVLSELMRPHPDSGIVRWLDGIPDEDAWISSVTVAEIRLGLALLPEGRRKKLLTNLAEQMFSEDFADNCLPFDCLAAGKYAEIVSSRTPTGRPITVEYGQIAAIPVTADLVLVTRNTKDFVGIEGLALINPWEATGSHCD